jgi:RHS repeat-associated protein
MKNKTKTVRKALSVFLAFLIVVQILPLQVLAESVTDAIAHKEFIEDVLNNPTYEDNTSDAEILYEVEEKRDEYTKVYKKSDGTYTAIMTEEPLHYLYNGVWEEINNSMSLTGNLYTNLDNLFNVEFPESIDSNENLTVEKDGYELSFSVDNIEESSAVVENDIVVSDTNISVADEAIAQTQSAVTYIDVAENTDLQYIVTPNSIKENIIVSDKESVKDTYTFTFETNGLDAEKLDDGSVVFKDENNEIKFRIPRPVMTDSSLAFSYDINVVLIENTGGTITLEYSPSSEWTNSYDRVYPITIDPAIMVENNDVSWVEDTFVVYDSSNGDTQNTNFYNDYVGAVANMTDDTGKQYFAEVYTRFNIDLLKSLGKNIIFTEVQYLFIGASADGKALAKKITTPTDLTTVTYESKPSLDNEIIDYYTSPYSTSDDVEASYIHFNITKPLNEWYNGAENNGFAIVPGNEGYVGLFQLNGTQTSSTGSTTTYTTGIVMDYVDVGGYNETLNYHSQSVGRAGTGYVNDFTQHLSVVRDDLSIDGNIMPVTVGIIYNSATYDKMSALNYNTMMAYGNGWAPNYLRGFVRMSDNQFTYYTENGAAIDYTYTIENDVVTFEETYSDIYGEHGYEIEYIAATDTEAEHIVITRPDGYEERFNNMGLLTSVTNPDYPSQKINIVYDTMFRIDYITDGVDRKYDYIYDNATNLLSKIKCYAANGTPITAGSTTFPLEVNYAYDENKNLISVTFPDGKSATYTYDANGNITSIANIDGYRIVYDYDANGKVTNITEQALDGTNYVNGNFITYDRLSPTQIKLTDGNGNYEVYQFNSNGTLLYITDRLGNYTLNNDIGSNNDTYFISSNYYRTNAENLLLNASFEDSDILTSRAKHWENSNSAFERTTSDNAYFGDYVYTASKTSNTTVYQKQTVEVLSGGEYTFSAYVKSDEANNGKLYLNISSYNGSNTKTKTESIPVESTGGEWQRYSVTLDAPSNTKKIVVEFGFKSSKGTFYVDNVQLEQASSANEYNYIENGGFRESFEGWKDEPTYSIVDTEINGSNEKAVIFDGDTDGENTVYQIVKIDGEKDDVFTIGGWLKGLFVNSSTNNPWILNNINETTNTNVFNFTNDRLAQIEVAYQYDVENEDGTTETLTETITVPFCENIDDWQFAAEDFALKGDCDEVLVVICYSKNANSALISNIELTKDEDAVVFSDEEETTPEETGTCKCDNCEEPNCTCTCESETSCNKAQCKCRGTIVGKDDFGNITSTTMFDGIKNIQTLSQYSEDGNYFISETDENGNTVTYDYSLLNGILNAITDARNNSTTYTYDASGNLTQVSSSNSSANYTYENDKLIAITHNGFSYNLSYDLWGQLIQVSVGSQPIITFVYGENEYRDRIVSSTYHNDDAEIYNKSVTTTTEYQYDELGNITEIIINGETKFIYTYDSFGGLTEISATDSRIIRYTDDRTDILDFNDNYIYSSYTNDDGDFIETIGGVTYTTKAYDSTYDVATGTTTEKSDVTTTNGKTIGTVAQQDWFGRYTESIIKTENANDTNPDNTFTAIKTEYTYPEYANNKTSSRPNSYVNTVYNGTSISEDTLNDYYGFYYEYDVNGNITAEYDYDTGYIGALRYSYTYDELNQLVRYDDNVSNPKRSYTYTYDTAGNILSKSTYSYRDPASSLGKVLSTDYYEYDNTWSDKITQFNSKPVNYDDIGNPTTLDGATLTWSGRQLDSYTFTEKDKDENENGVTKRIQYTYDENGLRHRKMVYVKPEGASDEAYTLITQYDYTWSNGKLINQVYTTYETDSPTTYAIKFIYDSFDTPQGFIINNSQMFLYLKNLQGDIVGVVDTREDIDNNIVLIYSYDAWGIPTTPVVSDDDELYEHMKKFLPFRYRGYCYDNDSGLYYLQSRYYHPKMGRFINTDDTQIAITTQETILGANLFTYCNNNPTNNIDTNGEAAISLFSCVLIGAGIGLILGGSSGAVVSYLKYKTVKWKYVIIGSIFGVAIGAISGYNIGVAIGATAHTTVGLSSIASNLAKNVNKLKFSKTIEKYAKTRKYYNYNSLIKQIIKSATPVKEKTGALKWLIPGTMNGTKGIWELVIDPKTKVIYHFLFNSKR